MAILVLASTAVLAAATAQPSAAELATQPIIVVTGQRLPAGAAEVQQRPGGSDLVMASEYKNRVAVSLRDALAFSPGVYAQPRFGQEIRLSIRGSGISRSYHMRGLTLLQDGIPINLADDNGDFQELDPAVLSHLEIYRGANAFRFGGTTLGGAINGVVPNGRNSNGFRTRVDGGSFGTLRGLASFGWKSDGADAWVAITRDRSDGDREHDKRRSLRGHANLGIGLASNVQTRFYISANRIEQKLPGALSYDLAIDNPKTGKFVGNQKRNIDSLRLQSRTTVELEDMDLEFGAFANAKKLFHPIYQVVDQKSLDKGMFARIGRESGRFEVHAGATARFGTVEAKRHANLDGKRGSRTFEADQSARTIDIYSEARFRTGKFSFVAGGIYTNGVRRQEQVFPIAATGKASFNQLSPRFGAIWQASDSVEVYANFSRSHELPGFIELAQISSFVPLAAQHAWTTEIGTRGKVGPAKFDISLYRAKVRNELLQFNVGPDIPASTFNADHTLHQGIEAGLDLKLANWAILRQVYQLNDFRFRADAQYDDNRLPVIPKHLYRAELKLGPKAWSISPSLEWVPQGAWADYANSFRADGYTTFNLSGAVKLLGSSELFVDIRNLTREKAVGDISAVVNYDTLTTSQQAIFYPIERRAVYAGVRANW
jgi:iron complex outermembrane receptor protein